MNPKPEKNSPDSQALLNQIVIDYMKEKKRKRRWSWIRRIIIALLLIFLYFKLLAVANKEEMQGEKPHAGLIKITGTLFDTETNSADNFAKGMKKAYKKKGLRAMILRINSPGGSPVQADYMYNTIQYYRKKYPKIPVYAVCVDGCASAAYYVASAATEIYANESTLVGSIGVIYSSFGFVDAIQKLGVTRRLQTAGINKAILDPFIPTTPEAQSLLQTMLDEVHQEFIKKVSEGRGNRLKKDNKTIFSGLFWTGKQALDLGLIDGFSSSSALARERLHLPLMIDYTQEQTVLEKMTKGIGVSMVGALLGTELLRSGLKAEL